MAYRETKVTNNTNVEIEFGEVQIDPTTTEKQVSKVHIIPAYGKVYLRSDALKEKSEFHKRAMFYYVLIGGMITGLAICPWFFLKCKEIVFAMDANSRNISWTSYAASYFGIFELRMFRSVPSLRGGDGKGKGIGECEGIGDGEGIGDDTRQRQ